jgi:predicted nucleic acid-binding protein
MPNARRGIVFDANVLINLIHGECLSLLPKLPDLDAITLDEVVAEVTYRDQRVALDAAIGRGELRCQSLTDIAVLQDFAELRSVLGRGEAACLAFADHFGSLLASDEKRAFRRLACSRLGESRIVTTPDVLLMAIRAALITVDEADGMKLLLESHRFKMEFGSFRELLGASDRATDVIGRG